MTSAVGVLITRVWYGGHLLAFAVLPVAIAAFFIIPKDKRIKPSAAAGRGVRTKLPGGVYYGAVLVFAFMVVYSVTGMNMSTHIALAGLGGSAQASAATAVMMGGGAVAGLFFPKVSRVLGDRLIPISFLMLFIGQSFFNIFSASLVMTFVAAAICGTSLGFSFPRIVFNVSNLTDPSNSATASMLISSIALGAANFLSPVIITNITFALAGESTRFRYQFSAFICLALAVLSLIKNRRDAKRAAAVLPK
jgi:hypothetical protein